MNAHSKSTSPSWSMEPALDGSAHDRSRFGPSAEDASAPNATSFYHNAREDEDQTPRFTRFAAQRVGRWRRQQALITVIEVLFVAGAVMALVLLR